MRSFNYSAFKEQKWDSGILGLKRPYTKRLENRSSI